MPIEFSEDLFQNDDFKVETDNNGNLVQTHKQTGAEFLFNATKNRWVPVQGLDLEGATIDNIGSLDSSAVDHDATTNKTHDGDSLTPQSIDVGSLSATQLAQALNANGNDISNVGQFDSDSLSTVSVDVSGQLKDTSTAQDSHIDIYDRSLADGGKAQLDPNNAKPQSIFYVFDPTSGGAASFATTANANGVDIFQNPASVLTTTEDNDGTINVYYHSGNSRYEINNELGSQQDIALIKLGRN